MFWKFRILFFYSLIAIFSLLSFFVVLLSISFFDISYNLKYKYSKLASFIFIKLAKIICSINYEVYGLEKLPSSPFILVSNHQSFWENFFMQLIIPKHSWVIKKELFNIPILGQGLRLLDPIAVDRSITHSAKKIIDNGINKLQQGLALIIFPEATRIPCYRNVKFRPSAAKLAIHAQVPLTLMVHNAGKIWPKGFWFKRPGLITVKILQTLNLEQLNQFEARELNQYMENIIHKEKNLL
ncbi:MAG: 1-acyl-sn-glycerol-3-phosphate acyltransferase [Rickettsia sp.]|nr:1-acyl-sn-glycerol-3-phosphate acyltransferase [Rickettsia sp.]